jgi:hypothetical protein
MKVFKIEVKGDSITFGYNPSAYATEWLHFGIYAEDDAYNVAHNLNAVFGVSVRQTDMDIEEVTELF